jgi:hypothetical protein
MPDYYGSPTGVIENEHLRLEYLLDAGPRIVRLSLVGSDTNLLAEPYDMHWTVPGGEFWIRGGHRLWSSPEMPELSSQPDNQPVDVTELDGRIRLQQPLQPGLLQQRTLDIRLHPTQAAVTIDHTITNTSQQAYTAAPWAITALALGGVAIISLASDQPEANQLLPNRNLVLWPYTLLNDPRLHLHDRWVQIDGKSMQPPCMVGVFNRFGWIGYLNQGVLFSKIFRPTPDAPHPDFQCNSDVYVYDRFLELETLGPLMQLEPGASASHHEEWRLQAGVTIPSSPQEFGQWLQSQIDNRKSGVSS